jgi:hypothetical protein
VPREIGLAAAIQLRHHCGRESGFHPVVVRAQPGELFPQSRLAGEVRALQLPEQVRLGLGTRLTATDAAQQKGRPGVVRA